MSLRWWKELLRSTRVSLMPRKLSINSQLFTSNTGIVIRTQVDREKTLPFTGLPIIHRHLIAHKWVKPLSWASTTISRTQFASLKVIATQVILIADSPRLKPYILIWSMQIIIPGMNLSPHLTNTYLSIRKALLTNSRVLSILWSRIIRQKGKNNSSSSLILSLATGDRILSFNSHRSLIISCFKLLTRDLILLPG